METISARRSQEDDVGHVKTLIGADVEVFQERYGEYKLSNLVENSYICITICEGAGRVVAFAAFNDAPPSGYSSEFMNWMKRYPTANDFTSSNSIWLAFFVADPLFEVDAVALALTTAFQTVSTLDFALYQLPNSTSHFVPIRDIFLIEEDVVKSEHVKNSFHGDALCVARRSKFVPDLYMRIARVEDTDDLAPIFNSQSEVLAEDYGEFFLADVISSQDSTHHALIGEASNGRAVGLLGITRDVELNVLQQAFELAPYNNLVKSHSDASGFDKESKSDDVIDPSDWVSLCHKNLRTTKEVFDKIAATYEGTDEAVPKGAVKAVDFLAEITDMGLEWGYHSESGTELGAVIMTEWGLDEESCVVWSNFKEWLTAKKQAKDDNEAFIAFTLWYSKTKGVRDMLLEVFEGVAEKGAARIDDFEISFASLTKSAKYSRKSLVKDAVRALDFKSLASSRGEGKAGDESEGITREEFETAIDNMETRLRLGKLIAKGLRIVLIGGPGAGKHTQAHLLSAKYGIPHISTGASLLEAAMDDTDESKVIASLLASKAEVTSDLVTTIIGNKLTAAGDSWILTGYGGNEIQANHLATFNPTHIITLTVGNDSAVARCTGRIYDAERDVVYNKTLSPPPEESKTDEKSTRWVVKDDLTLEEITKKVAKLVDPAATDLRTCSCIQAINADADVPAVCKDISDIVEYVDEDFDEAEDTIEDVVDSSVMGSGGLIKGEPNAFAIDLFCLDEGYESRAMDFLQAAFDTYSDRDYCILTLPHKSVENSLITLFNQVPSKTLGCFSHVLYVVHRSALVGHASMTVHVSSVKDVSGIRKLVSGLPNETEMGDAFQRCSEDSESKDSIADREEIALVFKVENQAIGGAIFHRREMALEDVLALKSAYQLDEFIDYSQHRAAMQATLSHFVINPVFARCTRFAMKECMRIYHKTLFYFRQGLGETIPPAILREFVPVRARRTPSSREANSNPLAVKSTEKTIDPSFALYFLSVRLLTEPKIVKNDRIVVVGASDCGMAIVETLTMTPYMYFPHITLISPNGLPFSQGDAPFVPLQCDGIPSGGSRDIALAASTLVVKSKLVNIDREARCAVLADGALVPYDLLTLATGVQDATARQLGFHPEGKMPKGLHFLVGQEAASALDDDVYKTFAETNGHVVVYGSTLTTLTAIHALVERGVVGNRITLVRPSKDIHQVADDETVHGRISDALGDHGVTVLDGHVLTKVDEGPKGRVTAVEIEPVGGSGSGRRIACGLVICADKPDADEHVFNTINECGLVYDGRIVVDHNFRTTDEQIFAAGSVTKFSRKYRSSTLLENYDSREIGVKLATHFLGLLDPLAPASDAPDTVVVARKASADTFIQAKVLLPKFVLPKAVGGTIVGSLEYFHASSIDIPGPTRTLITDVEGGGKYCKVTMDKHDRVAAITYLGHAIVETSNLKQLIGMPVEALNGIDAGFSSGEITDIIAFLQQNWAQALYHDKLRYFLSVLKDKMKDDDGVLDIISAMQEGIDNGETPSELTLRRRGVIGIGGSSLPSTTKQAIEQQLLSLLRENRLALPQYYLPGSSVAV